MASAASGTGMRYHVALLFDDASRCPCTWHSLTSDQSRPSANEVLFWSSATLCIFVTISDHSKIVPNPGPVGLLGDFCS